MEERRELPRMPDFLVTVSESPEMSDRMSEMRVDNAMISLVINVLIHGDETI